MANCLQIKLDYRIICVLILITVCQFGCGHQARDTTADAQTISVGLENGEIALASSIPSIDVLPNVLHTVKLDIRNTGNRDLKNVEPRLPCRCNIVQSLPALVQPGSTNSLIVRVLTPFAGTLVKEIEFFDEEQVFVGAIQLTVRVNAAVPRLAHPVKPISVRHVAGSTNRHFVEFEAVEKAGAPDYIRGLSASDECGLVVSDPACFVIANIDSATVLRKYIFPVEVVATEDVNTNLTMQFSDGENGLLIPARIHVLPPAQLIPENLVLCPAGNESGNSQGEMFRVIPRVSGEIYEVESFDHCLLTIRKAFASGRQQWLVRAAAPHVVPTRTKVTLISRSGDRRELVVSIE